MSKIIQPQSDAQRYAFKCDLCGSARRQRLVAGDPDPARTGQRTAFCLCCGWLYKLGAPANSKGAATVSLGLTMMKWRVMSALSRTRQISAAVEPFVDMERPVRILDVGGGNGYVSRAFADIGHSVDIVDVFVPEASQERVRYFNSEFSSFRPVEKYDLVLMNHVLEHVSSPSQALSHARELLNDGGVIFVEVPFELYTPLLKRKLGDPEHIGYFCRGTLRRFLAKAGFETLALERMLSPYDSRDVMVLRGVARKAAVSEAAAGGLGWLKTIFEMVHPRQLLLMMRRGNAESS
jgi:SAM-dependent methyltransferase